MSALAQSQSFRARWRRPEADVRSPLRRQSLDNPALGDGTAVTGVDDRLQLATKRLKVSDLPIHFPKMFVGNSIDASAIAIPIVGQTE